MRKKTALFLAAFFLLFGLSLSPQTYSDTDIISVEKTPHTAKILQEIGLDLLMEWKGRIYIVACRSNGDLGRLEDARIPFRIETQNFYPYSDRDFSVQSSINGDFHSYAELERDLMALEEAHPGIARLHDIGDSLEGRNIYALKISDNASFDENEAEVLFIGCH
ncbi:MAG: M14 family zinc carboxypeptidase, partial [Candidatus Aminicenantales bacterium]